MDTLHSVKKVSRKPHSKTSTGGLKYTLEMCRRCGLRLYNGKEKGEKSDDKPKKGKFITTR